MELTLTAEPTSDLSAILSIHRAAFGQRTEADLVRDLLADPTAQPSVSITANSGAQPVGHILFTRIRIEAATPAITASILCPLAILPSFQTRGVGSALIRDGLQRLRDAKCDLVFVLGDPAYYGRFGFEQADFALFPTPQLIPDHYQPGWMMQSLTGDAHRDWRGQMTCADALNKPEYWSE